MSIIAYPLEATEYTAEDVQTYLSTRTSGVYSDEITFTPEGMTVTVSPFLAWFNYAKFKGCSVAVTEPETLTFSPAHAVLDRIDRIALRVDFTLNKAYFTVIEGTPSSSPVPPNISKTEAVNDISPAYVKIKAGATKITPADIKSTILDYSVCGIMRDGVTRIPTSQLQSQAEALISRLHDAINEVQANSAFMLWGIYDPEKKAKPVAFDNEVLKKEKNTTNVIVDGGSTAKYFANIRDIDNSKWESRFGILKFSQEIALALSLFKDEYFSEALSRIVLFEDAVKVSLNGSSALYNLFGEHNKPTGTFRGNGSGDTRTIETGGLGNLIIIKSQHGTAIVTPQGGFSRRYEDVTGIGSDACNYENGLLTITSTSNFLNNANYTYTYYCI